MNKHIYAAHPRSTTLPFFTSDCAKGRRHSLFSMENKSAIRFRTAEHSTAGTKLRPQTGSQAGNDKILNEHCSEEHEGNALPCSMVCRILRGHSFNVLCTPFPVCYSPCLWKILQKSIRNLYCKLLQFTSSGTISNALMFSTNLSYTYAHIQEFSKFKLMYATILKLCKSIFSKSSLRVLSKHFMNFWKNVLQCFNTVPSVLGPNYRNVHSV